MKPFATLGSEISKVRDRVRRGAEALRPAKVASDVRDQRDRLLAKLGEQTFRLIAERKLQVPKVLQDSVEKLATLLGVQLPPPMSSSEAVAMRGSSDSATELARATEKTSRGISAASDPLQEPAEVDEPSLGDAFEATPRPAQVAPTPLPARAPVKPAPAARSKSQGKKKGAKRSGRR